MAAGSARSSAAAKHAYRMFAPSSRGAPRCPGSPGGAAAADEFDESDVWGALGAATGTGVDYSVVVPPAAEMNQQAGARARPIPAAAGRKQQKPAAGAAPGSLPMNIPDWQKILGVEYRDHHHAGEWELDGDDDDDGYGGRVAMVPPHELAWRSRGASMSVHEGIGRTLKGRDLSRVRDAVWKRTGFED
ncbi:hypothetical protein PR202_gb14985 [Eleusine coracana subsp. coracana]|uniref:Senescence regulator n=1 Tax=Eleusine coracana subsp. coracana TaxID=191504 RepID=A0AAV5EUH9_ELECO|nr:hypothetical protein QOZ80_4BG0341500 [Eleusine coracana subsp. coracana]GJN27009.1 hypothetical protein PR202_gb14985 [Eleusine coracana subsp. coracana]